MSSDSRRLRRPAGVTGLALFFLTGSAIAAACGVALAFPGSFLEPMWRLNPRAREAFGVLGAWSIVLMACVAVACASGIGLWLGRRGGYRLAIGVLAVNLAGDLVNGLWRDPRALAGVPIAGAMLLYLRSKSVRAFFSPRAGSD